MNVSMHGKEIDRFATSEGCFIYSGRVTGKCQSWLQFSATYHGDRDEFWVVLWDGQGNETARWNAKTLHAIEWSKFPQNEATKP